MLPMRILAAPGPVSYPIIASTLRNKDVEITFGKESGENVDVVLDSTVSLARRNLRIDYVTIKGLMVIHPDVGKRIGVWRKGSAADVLTRALLAKKSISAELVYADEMPQLMALLKDGKVDSVVVSSALAKGKTFEELLNVPGSCGATVFRNEDEFVRLYNEGIEIIRQDPEGSAQYVLSKLPIKVQKEFIIGNIMNSKVEVTKLNSDVEFKNLIREFV